MPRKPRVTISERVRLAIKLPRPEKKRGLARAKLPVPSFTVLTGITLGASLADATSAFNGWRIYLNVDDRDLFDGEPLSSVDRAQLLTSRPVRGLHADPMVLTTRDEPVEVVLGVEWRGRGKPRRLPKGVEVVIHGHR